MIDCLTTDLMNKSRALMYQIRIFNVHDNRQNQDIQIYSRQKFVFASQRLLFLLPCSMQGRFDRWYLLILPQNILFRAQWRD